TVFLLAQHLHICLLMFTDAEVSCQLGQSCILPCRFTPGDDLVIHWFKLTPTNTKVHCYYDNKDHLEDQHQRFRGKTSLFQDQISKGNASLQLTGVMVQDEGRYQCHTSTVTHKNTSLLTVRIVCVIGSGHIMTPIVSCQFGQSCILPCSFTPGDHLEINWIQLTTTLTEVHSYYDNKDQLEHQDQRFKGRTSLFQDQISKGNASLQLTGVKVQDQGPYRCLTSTIPGTPNLCLQPQHFHICLLMFTDAEVSCQFGQSCILPCRFPPGDDLVIHWFKLTPTNTKVHSYYDNKDHLEHQHQRFRGRTSLFQDQISKGNASLQLTGVMVQDEGSYQCYTSTITETGEFYINMKVYGTRNPENWRKSKCFSSVSPIQSIRHS
uniref:Ig-like domain-containing protein n=1 Tax=Oryzias latipes TaxID=8090 RepID=A0A3P9HQD6_ORYLA